MLAQGVYKATKGFKRQISKNVWATNNLLPMQQVEMARRAMAMGKGELLNVDL